ncbi:MAG: BACON domain-containing protein [Prevotella sp.]|nr:BACON domain-containing protein [Prevotella sp.]
MMITGVLLSISGCDDSYPHDNQSLTPSMTARYLHCGESKLDFEYTASSRSMSVESVNTPWSLSCAADWLNISPLSGSADASINVSVNENPSCDVVRTSIVTLKSDVSDYGYSQEMEVTQAKAVPYLNISATEEISFVATGETKTVNVSSNFDYTVRSSESWMIVTKSADNKTITLKAEANPTAERRRAYIYIEGLSNKTINVSQEPSGMTSSQTTPVSVPVEGGSYNIQLQSDAPWTASSGSYSWISVTPNQGSAGTSNVLLEVAPNSTTSARTGYVQFKIGSTSLVEVKIEQAGIYLDVSTNFVSFDADACSRDITVSSNREWKVLSKPSWIKAPEQSVMGDGTLTLSVDDYNNTTSRNDILTIGIEGLSIKQDIEVTQKGRTFDNLVGTLQFIASESTQKFTITTDGSWTATSSESWLTLSPASGKGATEVTATATENTTDEVREATITVKVGETEQTILVAQKAHYLTLTPTQFDALPSTGGSHKLTIGTDDSWKATTNASWITLNPESGTGDIVVTATAADNPSINSRKETVNITPSYATAVKAIILQNARYMTVNTHDIYFFYSGGESDPVEVNTDGTYSVTTSDSWLTINENGKTFTVTASENTSAEKREGKVVVSLTGLVEGESKVIEIPVIQRMKSQGPGKDDFSPDEDWSVVGGDSHFTISIVRFGNDEDWNLGVGGSAFKVTLTGFEDDSDWDKLIR